MLATLLGAEPRAVLGLTGPSDARAAMHLEYPADHAATSLAWKTCSRFAIPEFLEGGVVR